MDVSRRYKIVYFKEKDLVGHHIIMTYMVIIQ